MKSRLFGDVIRLFLEKKERSSDEFKKELSLIIPPHIKKMSPIAIAKSFEALYKNNLVTEYLFLDHFHLILKTRFLWFVMGRACPLVLKLLREAEFEVIIFSNRNVNSYGLLFIALLINNLIDYHMINVVL